MTEIKTRIGEKPNPVFEIYLNFILKSISYLTENTLRLYYEVHLAHVA